jgi:hypothetical protein
MTPPKVLGAPKPWSSVMMSNTLGAPFGGTTRGVHQGVDSEAFSLITPPNFGSGGGSCFPSSVVVALGEPGAPVICCVWAAVTAIAKNAVPVSSLRRACHILTLNIVIAPICSGNFAADGSVGKPNPPLA